MRGVKREVKASVVTTDRSSSISPVHPDVGLTAMGTVATTIELRYHRAIDRAVEKRGGRTGPPGLRGC